jgi:O-antigen/teichoic acid export membrane protein
MVPFVVVGLAAAVQVMRLVGGSEFASGGDSLRLLMFAGLVSAADIVLGLALIAIDRNRQALWLNAAALGLNVVLNLGFIPRWGAPGAAAATLVSESAVAVVALILLNRWAEGAAGAVRSTDRLIPLAACFAVFAGSRELLPAVVVAVLAGLSFGLATFAISGVSWREAGAAMRAPSLTLRRNLAGLR